jgi:hypothetical protein
MGRRSGVSPRRTASQRSRPVIVSFGIVETGSSSVDKGRDYQIRGLLEALEVVRFLQQRRRRADGDQLPLRMDLPEW